MSDRLGDRFAKAQLRIQELMEVAYESASLT